MKKLAIIGASYLQRPLVKKAIDMGLETHVFAWEEGNVVEDITDFYYPISIIKKEQILKKCNDIQIDGITSIASDLAMPTVNFIAHNLNLVGNSIEATRVSTDKFRMRQALKKADLPCPRFAYYDKPNFKKDNTFSFPVIVKPTDRSGARGVTKVNELEQVNIAIKKALENSINERAIVEEYIEGREFSVEMISFEGVHYHLAITDKVTTGAPHFVEKEHHQPADISQQVEEEIIKIVKKALDSLGIQNGASHSEVLLTSNGDIKIVEIGGRMGGEFIGSEMVELSTGYDFLKGVIQVALNEFEPIDEHELTKKYSGVYYVLPEPGKITSITDHSDRFESVREAITIMKEGDTVPEVIDGAGKRAGIIVYFHPYKRVILNPGEVLEFDTE